MASSKLQILSVILQLPFIMVCCVAIEPTPRASNRRTLRIVSYVIRQALLMLILMFGSTLQPYIVYMGSSSNGGGDDDSSHLQMLSSLTPRWISMFISCRVPVDRSNRMFCSVFLAVRREEFCWTPIITLSRASLLCLRRMKLRFYYLVIQQLILRKALTDVMMKLQFISNHVLIA